MAKTKTPLILTLYRGRGYLIEDADGGHWDGPRVYGSIHTPENPHRMYGGASHEIESYHCDECKWATRKCSLCKMPLAGVEIYRKCSTVKGVCAAHVTVEKRG